MVFKKTQYLPIPKYVRDELRMTVALRGYSSLKQGGGKKLKDQQLHMSNFYHGKGKSHPSQIMLLSEALYDYTDMYDVSIVASTNKKKRRQMFRYTLLKLV